MNDKAKKILTLCSRIFAWILVGITIFMMLFTIITVSTVDKNDRTIFGYRFYIVKSDSMSLSDKNADLDVHFNAGDIVVAKTVKDPASLQPGTIISFISSNNDESYGETITHMIRRVEKDGDRVVGYVTYGTNKDTDDEAVVEPSYILGEYAGKLPGVGYFFAFVKSTPGYILCILVPFLLLILYNGVDAVRLFRRYKQEQAAVLAAEKAEIAEERKQNAEILRELEALRAQLAAQNGKTDAPVDPSSEDKKDE